MYGRTGLEILGETGVWLRDLYHAEHEANSLGRNLVKELILEIRVLVGRGAARERVGWCSREQWSSVRR